jgi:Uma2 family endonuclease
MATKTLLTIADFAALPAKDDIRYELDEGQLVPMTFPRPRHNRIVRRILTLLDAFAREHKLGEVFPSDTGYILDAEYHTLRGPDVSFLRTARAATIDPDADIPGAPDLAVEVISRADSPTALDRKLRQYLTAGCHTVWFVFAESNTVTGYERTGVLRHFKRFDQLTAPDLLPGFSVPVAALFANIE